MFLEVVVVFNVSLPNDVVWPLTVWILGGFGGPS